ncbi:hypothetical protein FB565_003557 [Actinoplanes lutulentus]|uniref:Uncharacterized protein n=1 Tax=Actinoplanes lutulentus TaxID=1287878 RepID=A0A327Z4E0_9ACTN|nr:hypothetical protein [Actinoplanes lutulentus]MBB2943828.1 hypothetical protein [Actinoplanes lutulentus]RAK29370.1 hypothetical protein B0I29_118162 [Actinoplanes lutulentus]
MSHSEDPTTATRHLCAGAYLDEDFRDAALNEVYRQPHLAVAPSYGFTLGPVLGHCLRARAAALARDGVIVAALAGAVLSRALPVLLLVAGCSIGWAFWCRAQLRRFRPGRAPTSPADTPRLREIERLQYGNTVIHGFHPYVGAGEVIGTWGFAQRLLRPADPAGPPRAESEREFDRPPFAADDLVTHLGWHLGSLVGGPDAVSGQSIAGLTVTDRVFLAGTEARRLRPMTSPHEIGRIIRHPASPARHQLACQVVSGGGEVVTTVHVHVAVQGRSLYLEVTTTVLLPCADAYRAVDRDTPPSWWQTLCEGVVRTPAVALRAPARLIRALPTGRVPAGLDERLTRGFDHGARVGVRELGAAPADLDRHPDVRKHQRLIEHRVLAAVRDFLDAHGVLAETPSAPATQGV